MKPLKLASLLTSYPEEDFGQRLGELSEGLDLPAELRAAIDTGLEELDLRRSEYIWLFDQGRASLSETEYGRERALFKANQLADIAGFYRAFGFELLSFEMADHLSVELEFYTLLGEKLEYLRIAGEDEGVQVVQGAMEKFLKDHLGRFPQAVAERPAVKESGFYGSVMNWVAQSVKEECGVRGVSPEPAQWLDRPDEAAPDCCGSGVGGLG